MPHPGPRRAIVGVRISDAGIAAVDERAARRKVKRSEMLRVLLAYAIQNMPDGWNTPKNNVVE